VLVDGAAGAVGISTVQLARERGANVIGTASAVNHDYEQIAEAHRLSEGGHVRGKLVLLVD
jgi:NADPH-dependent curcumin reductase CurA